MLSYRIIIPSLPPEPTLLFLPHRSREISQRLLTLKAGVFDHTYNLPISPFPKSVPRVC